MPRRTSCVECGESLSVDNSHHGLTKFCSSVCNQAYNARRLRNLRARTAILTHVCQACGNTFTFTPIRGGMKMYCTSRCKSLAGRAKKLGVTVEDLSTRKAKQGYRCAICKRHEDELGRPLVWDHDHSCCSEGRQCGSCFRGYLCSECNSMLGYAYDDIERLVSAAEYLATWDEKRVTIT